jgi:hypothetical protein
VRWQDRADSDPISRYRQGLDVVLGEIRVENCQLAADISGQERRDAVPAKQPYIAAGHTPVGETTWRPWQPADPSSSGVGVATTVVTAEAGFQVAPRYQAHVVGERIVETEGAVAAFIVDGYAHVVEATALSFELRVSLPTGATAGTQKFSFDDYLGVARRALDMLLPWMPRSLAASEILGMNGPRLTIDQTLSYPVVMGFGTVDPLERSEFEAQLKYIADSNHTTIEKLIAANGFDLDSISLEIGQEIVLPAPAVSLNPPLVLQPDFMEVLEKDLAWHVVWTGVEG